ncbi:hypothetical protein NQ318_021118 [Aromia moschata]|uniref:Uncharacterized protein n=1 Tax=Aromia moschata TaxID=1265417 RepID=A0AAV8YIG1_9CUCU|nr:hypothetical protein NQ318_021118 [Aromia moschata]
MIITDNSATSSDESDSDCYREPATKYPRLSGKERYSRSCNRQFDDYSSSEAKQRVFEVRESLNLQNATQTIWGKKELTLQQKI